MDATNNKSRHRGHVARLDHAVPAWKALDVALRAKGGAVPSPGWHRPRGRPRQNMGGPCQERFRRPARLRNAPGC